MDIYSKTSLRNITDIIPKITNKNKITAFFLFLMKNYIPHKLTKIEFLKPITILEWKEYTQII